MVQGAEFVLFTITVHHIKTSSTAKIPFSHIVSLLFRLQLNPRRTSAPFSPGASYLTTTSDCALWLHFFITKSTSSFSIVFFFDRSPDILLYNCLMTHLKFQFCLTRVPPCSWIFFNVFLDFLLTTLVGQN